MPRQYRIGVVGFGVAGATVSFLLAQQGHIVELFERAPQVGPVGAGILLQPSGQAILKRLGLLEQVAGLGEPIDELHALTHRGHTLIRMPYREIEPGCHALGVHRGDLFQVLHDQVKAQGVPVHLGHEIHSCRVAKGEVHLRDALGRTHGPFDFVLAADGSRSLLRGDSRLTKRAHEYAHGALWAIGQCRAVRGKLHQVTRGTQQLMGLLPMSKGRCSLFWSLRRVEHQQTLQVGFPAWKRQVLQLCPLAEELFDSLTDFTQVAFTTYQHVWMRRWHDAHVLFLGDAAHAMSPHLGQGVNLALLDAFCFTESLARAPDHRQAFRQHTANRARHVRYYAAVTALLTPFFQSGGFIKGMGRDMTLPWLPHVPWVRRQMLLTMAGLKCGFLGGRLSI